MDVTANGGEQPNLTISLLGPFEVHLDGRLVTDEFRTRKERALLAYLVARAGRVHRRENLAELLWPERPEGYARTNLRQALYGLRRALGGQNSPYLRITDEVIEFKAQYAADLDVQVFNALIQSSLSHPHQRLDACPDCARGLITAVDLYRGDFLEDISLNNSQGFQEWVVFNREQYHRDLLGALHNLSDYYQRDGDFERAHQYAWRYVNLAPLEEAAHRQLMNLLALNGQRSAALEQYRACQHILSKELGIQPSPETSALYDRIRTGLVQDLGPTIGDLKLTNLPAHLTAFVGRASEIERLEECLANPACRLMTVGGMAGVGKSRLAQHVAASQLEAFPDGVWFVPLAETETVEDLAGLIARTLDLSLDKGNQPQDQLYRRLRPLKTLLLLDQFEHLLGATGFLVELLRQAPQVKIVVTSRQRLNYRSACLFELGGLPYPQEGPLRSPADFPAVQLFLTRAHHSRTGFAFTENNQSHILRICQLVDGLPLGIELAAARLREFTCEQIAAGLQKGPGILTTTVQDIPARHRSLRAALEPSWEGLSLAEKQLFVHLAQFEGEFTLEQAGQVAGATRAKLLELLGKYFLTSRTPGRYAIHPLLRGYAQEKTRPLSRVELEADQAADTALEAVPTYDPLTNLPGYDLFFDRLNHFLDRATRRQQMAAVVLLSLEGLEPLRQPAAQHNLNSALLSLAQRFRSCLRKSDTLARVGEDEFAFLLEEISGVQDCMRVAERIASSVESFTVGGDEIRLRVYMGGSVYPWDSDQAETLLQRAGVALDKARETGVTCQLFTRRMDQS